jgi:hypothetical protein
LLPEEPDEQTDNQPDPQKLSAIPVGNSQGSAFQLGRRQPRDVAKSEAMDFAYKRVMALAWVIVMIIFVVIYNYSRANP